MKEYWDIVDEKRNKIGKKILKGEEKVPKGYYHECVAVWIMNSDNKFLIQKRSPDKEGFPNQWAMTTGSSQAGETTRDAGKREVKEELGIDIKTEDLDYMTTLDLADAFIDVYMVKKDVDLKDCKIQLEELTEIKWASYDEFEDLGQDGEFIRKKWNDYGPYIKKYFN